MHLWRHAICAVAICVLTAATGCQPQEKIIDIETPGGEVEVFKSPDSGEVEIEAKEKE